MGRDSSDPAPPLQVSLQGTSGNTQQAPSRGPEASWPFLVFIGDGGIGGRGVVLTLPEEVYSCDLLIPELSGHLWAWPSGLDECTRQPSRPPPALEAERGCAQDNCRPSPSAGSEGPKTLHLTAPGAGGLALLVCGVHALACGCPAAQDPGDAMGAAPTPRELVLSAFRMRQPHVSGRPIATPPTSPPPRGGCRRASCLFRNSSQL